MIKIRQIIHRPHRRRRLFPRCHRSRKFSGSRRPLTPLSLLLLWSPFPNLAELRLDGSKASSDIVHGEATVVVDGTCVAPAEEEEDCGDEAEDGAASYGDAGDLGGVYWCGLCN